MGKTEAAAKNSCWDFVSKTNKGFALTAPRTCIFGILGDNRRHCQPCMTRVGVFRMLSRFKL